METCLGRGGGYILFSKSVKSLRLREGLCSLVKEMENAEERMPPETVSA